MKGECNGELRGVRFSADIVTDLGLRKAMLDKCMRRWAETRILWIHLLRAELQPI